MAAHTRQSKAESIERTYQKYYMRLAQLQHLEDPKLTPDPDPEEMARLSREVRYYHGQLVNKGAICPNET